MVYANRSKNNVQGVYRNQCYVQRLKECGDKKDETTPMQEGGTTEDPSIHHDVPVKQCQIRIIPVDAIVKESDGKIKAEETNIRA